MSARDWQMLLSNHLGADSKTQVINAAWLEYARRKRLKALLDLRGQAPWDGDLEAVRGRSTGTGDDMEHLHR